MNLSLWLLKDLFNSFCVNTLCYRYQGTCLHDSFSMPCRRPSQQQIWRDSLLQMPRNLSSSAFMRPFVVLALPGMYLFYKYSQYKRQQQEQNRRKVTERELAHLNHKIVSLKSYIHTYNTWIIAGARMCLLQEQFCDQMKHNRDHVIVIVGNITLQLLGLCCGQIISWY